MRKTSFTGHSDIGGRTSQQDCFGVMPSEKPRGPHLAVVLDGAGGHSNGAQASDLGLRQVIANVKDILPDMTPDDILDTLSKIVARAHIKIIENAQSPASSKGMATTIVLTCILDNQAHIVWVGDSRAYMLRNDELHRLTCDHSQVQEFVLRDMISNDQARLHPQKNIITRALGCRDSRPDGITINLEDGDQILLASDGIMDALDDEQIIQILLGNESDKAKAVVESAVKASTKDNATAVWYEHIAQPHEPVSRFYPLQVARLSALDTESQNSDGQIEIFDRLNLRETHQIKNAKTLHIGRGRNNDISIPDDPYLNNQHLKIEQDDAGYIVTDLNSRNGCYLKLPSEPTKVSAPFELVIGSHLLKISANNEGGNDDA